MNCTILLLSFCISVTSVVGASGPEADFSIANEIPVLEAFFGTANLNLAQFTDPTLSNQEEDDDPVGPTPIIEDVPGAVGLLRRHGYRVEVHNVETDDGYILQLKHIIGNFDTARNCPTKQRPILMVHGLFDSSATGPSDSLATQLTDLCYDVWLGNTRGNRHSRRHVTLNPDGRRRERREFWSFSWHQIGMYDLPALIDYVLWENGQFRKLFYVSHSQGTTSFFVMASKRPEYNDKIQFASCLAPVAIMQHVNSPVGRTMAQLLLMNQRALGKLEFLPGEDLMAGIQQRLCATRIGSVVCESMLFLVAGHNPDLFNQTALNDILEHTPAGSAAGQVIHYRQLVNAPDFREFDFGTIENLRRYGSRRPPIYNTTNIRAPVALYYSQNDLLAARE